jgi:hypothetical protein
MKPKEKAHDLINKMNGQVITPEEWAKLSDDVKKELKRKCNIVIDEIMQTNPTIKGTSEDLVTQIVQTKAYYVQVQGYLNSL